MKKIFALMIVVVLMVASLSACGNGESVNTSPTTQQTEAPTTEVTSPPTTEAPEVSWPLTYVPVYEENPQYLSFNQQNQVQNDGTFLVKNGWIYGQSWDDNGNSQFVKVRTDFTDWTVLDDGFAIHINVVDNYVYYMQMVGDYGIYKVKTSGEDKQLLVKAFGKMQIVGDQIYYTDYMYNGVYDDVSGDDSCYHLYRCDLNGENVVEIIDKPTFHAFVFADGILYQDDRDNMSLHICDLDGKNDIKLNNSMSFWPIYDGQYLLCTCRRF